jgi:Asp-tRNA(Asn)/Glu-tRNA(Gln) amidotransferase A subunit family amidase
MEHGADCERIERGFGRRRGCWHRADGAIGSDGGGSIRIPGSINGLFGLKGSMGRVPLYPGTKDETAPGVSGWESIEHIGPLTRTVADGALMMSVIASGPDDRDRRTVPNDVNWMEAIKGDIKGLSVARLGLRPGRSGSSRGLRQRREGVRRQARLQA